jgi:hypothetical protein
MSKEDALEALRGLALRSESAEAVDPLIAEISAEVLPDPGVPLMIVVTVDADGQGNSRYLCEPEKASAILHNIAEDIVRQAAEQRAIEDIL